MAGVEVGRPAGGLIRREMNLRPVLEQSSVEITAGPIERLAHPSLNLKVLPRRCQPGGRARGRPLIDDRLTGRLAGHRKRLDHRYRH
jgi:hypothetical protein